MRGAEGRRRMLLTWARMVLLDYQGWVVENTRHVAYLARYAPGLGLTEDWPLSKIITYVKLTSDIVSRENDAGKGK